MLCLAISGLGRRAGAQSDSGAAPRAETNEVVITGTRTPEQSQRAVIKTDVVSRDEAERRGATNVAEALSTQPGVQVNPGAYGYLGTISPIQIQGFDLGRVLILEDGEPVIGDVGGAIDLAGIPIADLQRIEIVTGPSSALYGSSAIGGVVNLIGATPAREGPSAQARAEYRSHRGVVLQGERRASSAEHLGQARSLAHDPSWRGRSAGPSGHADPEDRALARRAACRHAAQSQHRAQLARALAASALRRRRVH